MRTIFAFICLFNNIFLIGCREVTLVYNTHHPQLDIQLVLEHSKKALLFTTSKAIEGHTFKVSNARCTLTIECTPMDNTFPKTYNYEVQNISPESDGGFHGLWIINDSLLNCRKLCASACISDTMGKYSCDTIIVFPREMKTK